MAETREVYLIAGEASGDRHGAELVNALKRAQPDLICSGVGGRYMKAAGQDQLFDLAEHAVVGLTDVLRNYFKFKKFFDQILADIKRRRPEVVVFIDYPGMNLRLARQLRATTPGLKLAYYISPQVWAWKSGRAKLMEEILDLMLVIFPFEKDWFSERTPKLKVEWVGHPILDRWDLERIEKPEEGGPCRIALMPGSRKKELQAHLEILLQTVTLLRSRFGEVEVSVLAADENAQTTISESIQASGMTGVEILSGYQLTHLSRCHLVLAASGTATLECAMAQVPLIVLYKSNPITFAVGKRLVKLPYISMVNILAGKRVVPEFLQGDANPEALSLAAAELLSNREAREEMKGNLKQVVSGLGQAGCSDRAADEILSLLP
ncbi:MAG: lipid-A-disaccharide synthase [Verrucomicrobiota bacterium]